MSISLNEVRQAAESIRSEAASSTRADHEALHADEDDLHIRVLTAIAEGALTPDEARAAAAIAMTTQDVEFHRWCA